MNSHLSPEGSWESLAKAGRPTSLLQRFATPEEVAALVTYVASPVSAATNGAALRVDGGTIKSAF
jgi:NAD(P)-dependent dehydrogenase (short-subunit alcohol dehydrogenase family)